MDEEPPAGEFPMRTCLGVPDGLVAWAQPSGPDGTYLIDRKGVPKVRRVIVRAADRPRPHRPEGLLTDAEWTWATTTDRLWRGIVGRLGERAQQTCLTLAKAGCVDLEQTYSKGGIKNPPIRWIPHPDLIADQAQQNEERRDKRAALSETAAQLRRLLSEEWPGAAASLNRADHDPKLRWLVHAAHDLATGRSHDGARAFVSAHNPEDGKARDNLARELLALGWEPGALDLLGISRSPYIGLGGPLQLTSGDRTLDFTTWSGPHDIRLAPHHTFNIQVKPGTQTLLIVENRQAAEALCDSYPDIAIIWCRGQHSDRVLQLIQQAATDVERAIICPDADLGGVRIAARIFERLPTSLTRLVVDAGAVEHPRGRKLGPIAISQLRNYAQREDAPGHLARACLERGYIVEQEASIRAAIREALS